MSKVDFYVLRAAGDLARQQFACRLAEKAYRLQHKVHIHTANLEEARRVDELLWTFRDGSFVPHQLVQATDDEPDAPVTIGCKSDLSPDCELIINLGSSIPAAVSSTGRVAEIVSADDDCKAVSRNRFVEYRNQGHTLSTHKI